MATVPSRRSIVIGKAGSKDTITIPFPKMDAKEWDDAVVYWKDHGAEIMADGIRVDGSIEMTMEDGKWGGFSMPEGLAKEISSVYGIPSPLLGHSVLEIEVPKPGDIITPEWADRLNKFASAIGILPGTPIDDVLEQYIARVAELRKSPRWLGSDRFVPDIDPSWVAASVVEEEDLPDEITGQIVIYAKYSDTETSDILNMRFGWTGNNYMKITFEASANFELAFGLVQRDGDIITFWGLQIKLIYTDWASQQWVARRITYDDTFLVNSYENDVKNLRPLRDLFVDPVTGILYDERPEYE